MTEIMRLSGEKVTQTMQTLYDCIVKAVERGYYESFRLSNTGLTITDGKLTYNPADITIANKFACKSYANDETGSVLYLIKTFDGRKGTLLDPNGDSVNANPTNFIQQVKLLSKSLDQRRKFWFNFLIR